MPGLIPDAGPGWETALLLPVPAAEPAVSRHRARLDEAARDGVPAHITVLHPFMPPAGISKPLLGSLGRLFAGFAAFECMPRRHARASFCGREDRGHRRPRGKPAPFLSRPPRSAAERTCR